MESGRKGPGFTCPWDPAGQPSSSKHSRRWPGGEAAEAQECPQGGRHPDHEILGRARDGRLFRAMLSPIHRVSSLALNCLLWGDPGNLPPVGPSRSSKRCRLCSAWRPPPPGSLPTGPLPMVHGLFRKLLPSVLGPDETSQCPALSAHFLGASLVSQGTEALSHLQGAPKHPYRFQVKRTSLKRAQPLWQVMRPRSSRKGPLFPRLLLPVPFFPPYPAGRPQRQGGSFPLDTRREQSSCFRGSQMGTKCCSFGVTGETG